MPSGLSRRLGMWSLVALVVLAGAYVFTREPAPRVRVLWREGITVPQRAALEAQYLLHNGRDRLPEGSLAYDLLDTSRANIRRLVQDPAVADTNDIDRETYLVEPGTDRGVEWTWMAYRIPGLRVFRSRVALVVVLAVGALAGLRREWLCVLRASAHYGTGLWARSQLFSYAVIAVALQLAIALWVPVNRTLIPGGEAYLTVSLTDRVQPRALIGTVARVVGMTNGQFVIATQVALFAWIFAMAILIATPRGERIPRRPDLYTLGLVFLFAFSTLPFITNAFSGMLDIYAATVLTVPVWLLYHAGAASIWSPLAVALCLGTATLIHDKSVFESAILLSWIAATRRWRDTVVAAAAFGLFLAGYFYVTSGEQAAGSRMTLGEYLLLVADVRSFLEKHSFNVAGVLFGGGVLWALYAGLGLRFVRDARGGGQSLLRSLLVIEMAILCLAPLAIGWDTNRLVAILWLPTILLLSELDIAASRGWTRRGATVLAIACVLQALVPPVLVYQHQAIALNCYASTVVERFERVRRAGMWPFASGVGPLTLGLHGDRPDVSELYGCAPVHLTRP